MAKSIILDRVAVIAEMARQDLTTEELSRKAGVGRSAVSKARIGGAMWRTTAGHIADALGVPLESIRLPPQEQEVQHVERQQ